VKVMVKDHMKDIADFKKDARASQSPATYAEGAIPTLQKHLHMAQALERHPSG